MSADMAHTATERRKAPQSVDVRGCPVFRWRLSSSSITDEVICRLPPQLITYVIHTDGKIQRRTPKEITPGFEETIAYIYLDQSGHNHDLGKYCFIEARRHLPGNVEVEGSVRLIDLRKVHKKYKLGNVSYGFTLNTSRYYIGDVALASLFGAMLEAGYDDVVCNGFSDHLGHSVGGSSSHVNGTNGDFRYLRNDGTVGPLHLAEAEGKPHLLDEERQAVFIEALYRFGWKSMLSYRYVIDGKEKLLKRTRHLRNHHHHLHLQGYAPLVEDIHD